MLVSSGNKIRLHLDQLIPLNQQDRDLLDVPTIFETLCEPWSNEVLCRSISILEMLPDLSPEIATLLADISEWDGESVHQVHVFVDGSSFDQLSQGSGPAAWAMIIVLECCHDHTNRYKFYGAASAELSFRPGLCVGERSLDALAAEAVAMIWTQAWVMQSTFEQHHVVHYDNSTIGPYAAGIASWRLTDEY